MKLTDLIEERQKEATKMFFEGFTSNGEILIDEDGTQAPIWISHFIESQVKDSMTLAYEAGQKTERERWIEQFGENFSKSQQEVIKNAFLQGIEMTKQSYDDALKQALTPPTTEDLSGKTN